MDKGRERTIQRVFPERVRRTTQKLPWAEPGPRSNGWRFLLWGQVVLTAPPGGLDQFQPGPVPADEGSPLTSAPNLKLLRMCLLDLSRMRVAGLQACVPFRQVGSPGCITACSSTYLLDLLVPVFLILTTLLEWIIMVSHCGF